MQEELIISGRDIPKIDPHLAAWHWPIPVDLFLGGLAAGILFFTAYYVLSGNEKKMSSGMKWSTFLAPVAIGLALFALFIDLTNKINFWRLYTTLKIQSPMSLGSWVLLFITPLSILWAGSFLKELIPGWNWKLGLLNKLDQWVTQKRKEIAWALIFLSVGLGIYTGILLSAFNARPLWNTALMGPLFLTSGLCTGAAAIYWFSSDMRERLKLAKVVLILIGIQLFFIVHLFMGFLAGPEAQLEAAAMFINGEFALPFWGIVVILGLLIPGILEFLQIRGMKIPAYIPALLILIGGLIFRFIIVEAGQLSSFPH